MNVTRQPVLQRWCLAIAFALITSQGTPVMAADAVADSPEVAALKERVAILTLQLQALQLEKNLAAAEAASDAAAQAAAQVAAAKSEAEAQKALADAQKAVSDAQVAALSAEQAALKAKFGVVTGSTATTGAVEIGEGGGNGEASLLAARAVENAAKDIHQAVRRALGTDPNGCIVYAGAQRPVLGHWRAFRVQLEIAHSAFALADAAKTRADEAAGVKAVVPETGSTPESAAAVTAAGAILDLGSKLGSYFQSDYKIMGATIAGSDDDLLATTVSGLLPGSWYPAKWMPPQGDQPVTDLLNPVATRRDQSIATLKSVQQSAEQLKAAAEKEADAEKKARLSALAANYTRAAEAYTAAQKRFDDLLTSLGTVDKDGVPLAVYVVDEKTLSDAIDRGSYLLFVKLNAPLGGRYTKKNLWTFFGGMPFYVSGGAIASYTLIEGRNGQVKAGGQFQVHSGYGKIHEVVRSFVPKPEKPINTTHSPTPANPPPPPPGG